MITSEALVRLLLLDRTFVDQQISVQVMGSLVVQLSIYVIFMSHTNGKEKKDGPKCFRS